MAQNGLHIVDACEGDLSLFEQARQRGYRMGAEASLRQSVGLRTVGKPGGVAGKAGILCELGSAEHFRAEHHPFAIILDGDEDRHIVAGLKYTVRGERGMAKADAA